MPPPSSRSSPARSAGLTVSALVSISLLILSPALPAAEAAPPPGPAPAVAATAEARDGPVSSGTSSGTSVGTLSVEDSPEAAPAGPDGDPRAVAGTPPVPDWVWPVGPGRTLLRSFVAPATAYSAGHRGIDIETTAGAPVVAVEAGVVHFAGTVVDRPLVSLRHADGLISSIEPVAPGVVEGQVVAAGEIIGTVAGVHCARPCVHLGVRLHGEYVSPLKYLGGLSPSVLLPTRRGEP